MQYIVHKRLNIYFLWKENLHRMVNNSTNINKTNNHLSSSTTEPKDHVALYYIKRPRCIVLHPKTMLHCIASKDHVALYYIQRCQKWFQQKLCYLQPVIVYMCSNIFILINCGFFMLPFITHYSLPIHNFYFMWH